MIRASAALATVVVALVVPAVVWSITDGSGGLPHDHGPLSDGALGALGPWPRAMPRPRAVLTDPIDLQQQTVIDFGERSHWLQPWRAYLDTVPAERLLSALGVNFNVTPMEAEATARLLASAGIRRARVELPWSAFRYSDPTRLRDPRGVRRVFRALARHRIRPLVLLNGHHGAPCPTRFFTAGLVAPAHAGDRAVRLDPATAAGVVPGRTGLNAPDGTKAADILFTSVAPDGVATLSKPLPRDLTAGPQPAATLRYAPFEPPRRPDGSPNPAFEATLVGWLSYARSAVRAVRTSIGSTRFDVEIWNELSLGSDFLDAGTYYDPPPQPGGDVAAAVLDRTVELLREPARGLSSVGVVNGFASERPWDSGATSPPGLTAIAKHPYADVRRFPKAARPTGVMPLDARGRPDGIALGKDKWRDRFVPRYTALFPEYFLTAIQTEHLIRDLSPVTTTVYGTPHGRQTHPPGGAPPEVWVTEWNLDPGAARSRPTRGPLTSHERRLQSKAILRAVLAYVNKGVGAFYIYAAQDSRLGIVRNSFLRSARRSRAYPGDRAGGSTVNAIRRLSASFRGARALGRSRELSLLGVGDYEGHAQFAGDGTRRHPALYDRDVVTFLPFRVDARRFVVGTYVMSRDIAVPMRPERFAFAIGGLGRCTLGVSASDPLLGRPVPVQRVSCSHRRLVVSLPLTDSPRLLSIRLQ